MRRARAAAALVSGALLFGMSIVGFAAGPPDAPQADPKRYRATGVIRSFGPDRTYVNIAHDEIPGYMSAMTMSFWPARKEQLDALVVGDRVAFEFTEAEDARRILATIGKRP
ncbi:MAG: copper-binding protein [Polyangiaceae bacterium]|jgi:Cu/Ag efflux protein CusF